MHMGDSKYYSKYANATDHQPLLDVGVPKWLIDRSVTKLLDLQERYQLSSLTDSWLIAVEEEDADIGRREFATRISAIAASIDRTYRFNPVIVIWLDEEIEDSDDPWGLGDDGGSSSDEEDDDEESEDEDSEDESCDARPRKMQRR